MESKEKPKIEYLPYKCFGCGQIFQFEKITPVEIHFSNGSILTHYYCEKCYKLSKKKKS